jgi:hypothetical protein
MSYYNLTLCSHVTESFVKLGAGKEQEGDTDEDLGCIAVGTSNDAYFLGASGKIVMLNGRSQCSVGCMKMSGYISLLIHCSLVAVPFDAAYFLLRQRSYMKDGK